MVPVIQLLLLLMKISVEQDSRKMLLVYVLQS